MDLLELMKARHSVRQYTDKSIEKKKRTELVKLAEECGRKSGLNIQIAFEEPECFRTLLAKFGKFKNCRNYMVIAGKKKDESLEEKAGYYGEKLVLKAQELGLNTCWVGMTHGKPKAEVDEEEKVVILIALGYGATQGTPHKNKKLSAVSGLTENLPEWYQRGIEAALLAPTAMNQQKFSFTLEGDSVSLDPGRGAYTMVDYGIVKYHFEAASGRKVR